MQYRKPANLILALCLAFGLWVGVDILHAAEGANEKPAACKSETKTPKEISAYVKNLADALRVIRKTAKDGGTCKPVASANTNPGTSAEDLWDRALGAVESASDDIVSAVNEGLAFSNFSNSARFYTNLILDSEIPKWTERDHRLLTKQQDSIDEAYRAVYAVCGADLPLPEDLGWIPKGTKLSEVLWKLTKNQVRLINFFRASVLSDDTTADFADPFILVGDDTQFRAAVKSNYADQGAETCKAEGGFFKRIGEAIDRIGKLGGNIGEAIKDWEAAWAMLNNASNVGGSNTLKISLGVDGEGGAGFSIGADLAAQNSKKYNNPPKALGIGAQLRSIGQKIVDGVEAIESQYFSVQQAIKQATHTEQIPPLLEKARTEREFNVSVVEEYTMLRTLIGTSNQTTQTNISELVQMHANLVNLSETMAKAIPTAEKTCDDQATGKGQCEYK